jgi:urea transport system ATP-binding protein
MESAAGVESLGVVGPGADALLEVQDLTVSFDGFRAVDQLSLSVMRNELRVIIGPNGAGKTTLLDMICGKTRPSAGRIRFAGQDLTHKTEFAITRLGVGRKFQTPSTYEDLTVLENLEISYPEKRGVIGSFLFRRTPKVKQRIDEIAYQVNLWEDLDATAGSLSHGQKQWLEIGMLLMQDPQLMLLDEPVAGMSPYEREQTAALLSAIAKGRAMVVIEHDMAFVEAIAHKVTVLHQGKLLCEGPMHEIQNDHRVIDVYLGN